MHTPNEQLLYHVALSMAPGIGSVLAKHLVAQFGEAKAIFDANKGRLIKTPGIGNKIASSITSFDLSKAEAEMEKAMDEGVSILTFLDKEYPIRMKRVMDSPALLYHKGETDLNAAYTVGIVGTRKATSYGKEAVEHILESISLSMKPLVVSGLAYGIDIHAHKASLSFDLPTVAVMANGIDTIYPSQHTKTARQMCEQGGGLLTEQPFGSKPDAPKFPERNRIIAAMSDVVIVVEATDSGGALITADFASQYHVPVFAVPGNIFSPASEGCNQLIANDKAKAFTDTATLITDIGWNVGTDDSTGGVKQIPVALEGEAKSVYEALTQGPIHIDNLSVVTGIGLSKLASILLELEFDGTVRSLPGKRFEVSR